MIPICLHAVLENKQEQSCNPYFFFFKKQKIGKFRSPVAKVNQTSLLHRFTFDLSKLDNHGCANSHYFHRINRDPSKQMCASVPVWCNGITNRIS